MSDGTPDLSELLAQAQAMQQRLLEAQEALASEVVEGQAGGGVVRITASAALEFRHVAIDPSAVDPGDVGMLEDLVLAALRDVTARAAECNREALQGFPGGGLLP